eukprot:6478730-Amphidinium_carterae.2
MPPNIEPTTRPIIAPSDSKSIYVVSEHNTVSRDHKTNSRAQRHSKTNKKRFFGPKPPKSTQNRNIRSLLDKHTTNNA